MVYFNKVLNKFKMYMSKLIPPLQYTQMHVCSNIVFYYFQCTPEAFQGATSRICSQPLASYHA